MKNVTNLPSAVDILPLSGRRLPLLNPYPVTDAFDVAHRCLLHSAIYRLINSSGAQRRSNERNVASRTVDARSFAVADKSLHVAYFYYCKVFVANQSSSHSTLDVRTDKKIGMIYHAAICGVVYHSKQAYIAYISRQS